MVVAARRVGRSRARRLGRGRRNVHADAPRVRDSRRRRPLAWPATSECALTQKTGQTGGRRDMSGYSWTDNRVRRAMATTLIVFLSFVLIGAKPGGGAPAQIRVNQVGY